MSKFRLTIIADEDIIDELASYPDSRLIFEGEPEEINDEEVENKVLKKVLLSELDIGQKFYFDGSDHECVVLHKITGNYGIVVYYKYIFTPSKLYSRYGDLFEVTVKEVEKNDK